MGNAEYMGSFLMALFVGKVDRDCREDDLRNLFEPFGKLARCTLKRGFAFVTFEEQEDADKACADLQGKELLGSTLFIEPAKQRNSGILPQCFPLYPFI